MADLDTTIAIVGAGPAGSFAAVRLAQAGLQVTLIERQPFPRDKVCGECLSALGISVLRRHGLAEPLERLRPATLLRVVLADTDGEATTHELPQPMWGLTRRRMDLTLRDAACDAGAHLLQPVRVEQISPLSTTCPGLARELVCRHPERGLLRLRAELVLLADGKAQFAHRKPAPTGDLGVKLHLTRVDFDRHAVALFALQGHYGGLAPVESLDEAPLWNVALSVPEAVVRRFRGQLEALWWQLIRQSRFLQQVCRGAVLARPPLACPLPRFAVRADWGPEVIPLGNAAAALEPIGGEGMGLALRSAELATEAILQARRERRPLDVTSLLADYQRLWRVRRPACRAVALAMSSPTLARTLVSAASASSAATAGVLTLMGKSTPALARTAARIQRVTHATHNE